MKKRTAFLISAALIVLFGGLVYYGVRYSRGVPVAVEEFKRPVVNIPLIDKEIDFAKGLSPELWQSLPKIDIELMHQVTVLPWGKSLVSPVTVKAFHNSNAVYFYLSWRDDTENRQIGTKKFSDACAIMFPLADKVEQSTIMMGFMGKSNIWQWKAVQDKEFWLREAPKTEAYADYHYPFEEKELFVVSKDIPKSAVNDLIAVRVGTITPKDIQNVQGRGFWANGSWQVVFKRPLAIKDAEIDAQLEPAGKNKLCAFAVWNGESGDRGGRKSISDWVELQIK